MRRIHVVRELTIRLTCCFQPSENIKIKVVGRCRPLTPEEIAKGSKSVVNIQGKDKIIINAAGKVNFFKSIFIF